MLGHSSAGFFFFLYQRTEISKREVKEHLLNLQSFNSCTLLVFMKNRLSGITPVWLSDNLKAIVL